MKRAALMIVPGTVFGIGLGVSGMTNPAKVIGFLDFAGDWDATLAFVMAGAIGAFALLNRVLGRNRARTPARRRFEPRLLIGATVFGIGWGASGFCPGPALANLAALRPEALVFVPAMAAGMVVAQRVFGADA